MWKSPSSKVKQMKQYIGIVVLGTGPQSDKVVVDIYIATDQQEQTLDQFLYGGVQMTEQPPWQNHRGCLVIRERDFKDLVTADHVAVAKQYGFTPERVAIHHWLYDFGLRALFV